MRRIHRNTRNSKSPALIVGAKSTTIENKLTEEALLLSILLEYGIDLKNRIINITGEIHEGTWDIFNVGMTYMENLGKGDITVTIASEGGSTYYAMSIVSRMKESKCKTVTKGYGHVMSAATLILASGTRRRLISDEAFFMWHEASYAVDGRHSENKATVRQIEREENLWCNKMAERTKKNAKFWKEKGVGIDAYFNAEQLVKMGIADEIF